MDNRIGIGMLVGLATFSSIYIWNSKNFSKTQKVILLLCIVFPPLQWGLMGINQRETEKINLLRENNILNKNYSKAEKICNKIINRFPGSSQNIDKRFKLYITQSTIFYIVARGFVLDNTKLSMRWDWSETENLITLKIEVTYNTTVEPKYQKGVSHSTQKTFTFTENESEEYIYMIKFTNSYIQNLIHKTRSKRRVCMLYYS